MSLLLQQGLAAVEFSVLARNIEEVEVDVAVVVGLELVAKGTIGKAEVLVNACKPRSHLIGRRTMGRSEMERKAETLERLNVLSGREIHFTQCSHSTSRLEEVFVLAEEGNGMMGKSCGKLVAGSEGAVRLPTPLMLLVEIAIGIQALLLEQVGTKRVGNHSRERLQGVGFEVREVPGTGQRIDADEVVELSQRDFFRCAFHESAAAHHVVIVEPLRRIRLQADMLGCICYLATGCAVLAEIIVIGGSHDVKFRQGIVEAMSLAFSKNALFGKDATQTLLGTKAGIEEGLPTADALHDFHRQHVGTKQLQLVVAYPLDFPQKLKGTVVAHLLVADIGHVVERLSLLVGTG